MPTVARKSNLPRFSPLFLGCAVSVHGGDIAMSRLSYCLFARRRNKDWTRSRSNKLSLLFQVQRVSREHLLRVHQTRQDLLLVCKPDDRFQRFVIAFQAIRERVGANDASPLG